jgi:hypothetical protein
MQDEETRPQENSHVQEIPFGKEFEGLVKSFNKWGARRITAQAGPALFRMLSAGTEIFFRRDLGERHFDGSAYASGILLWFLSMMGSCFAAALLPFSIGTPILFLLGLIKIPSIAISFFTGGALLARYWYLYKQNFERLQEFRATRRLYHSRSRGRPRWEDPLREEHIRIAALVILALLAPLIAVAFFASMYVTSILVAQQQAALWNNYLDAQDGKIRAQCLRSAMLGDSPVEITDLYKALSTEMDPELRQDVANANCDGPATMIVEPPQPAHNTATDQGQAPAAPIVATPAYPHGHEQTPQATTRTPSFVAEMFQDQAPQASPTTSAVIASPSPRPQGRKSKKKGAHAESAPPTENPTGQPSPEVQPTTRQAGAAQGLTRTFSLELLELLCSTFDEERIRQLVEQKADAPESLLPDSEILDTVRKLHEQFGRFEGGGKPLTVMFASPQPPPTGGGQGVSNTFSPELYEMLRATLSAQTFRQITKAKAETPENFPPDDELIRKLRQAPPETPQRNAYVGGLAEGILQQVAQA